MSEPLGEGATPPPELEAFPQPPTALDPVPFPITTPDPELPLHASRPALPRLRVEAGGLGAVLRNHDFRFLWLAQAASQLADKFLVFTLLVVVYDLSRSASAQSILLIAYTLPSVFLSAPAGVYADRIDKRTLMLGTNLIRGGLILLIPVVENVPGTAHHVFPLFVITFLFSAAGQVFAPAEAASIPSLVRRDQIMDATSLFMSTVIITLVLGVPAATLCIRLVGTQAPFYIAAGLFGVAALAVWRVGTSLRAVPKGSAPSQQVWRELREGLVILGASPALRLALGQLTVALVVVFTIFALGPPYMATVLNRAPEDTYILLIPATMGMVGTAAALGQVIKRLSRARTMVVAFASAGVSLVILGVVPRLFHSIGADSAAIALAIVPATLFGCGLGAVLIPAFTVLQERTTEASRGRIFGGIFTVINAAVAVPLLLAGTLADRFGVGAVVTGVGTVLVVLAVLAGTRFRAQLAILDEDGDGQGGGGRLEAGVPVPPSQAPDVTTR